MYEMAFVCSQLDNTRSGERPDGLYDTCVHSHQTAVVRTRRLHTRENVLTLMMFVLKRMIWSQQIMARSGLGPRTKIKPDVCPLSHVVDSIDEEFTLDSEVYG